MQWPNRKYQKIVQRRRTRQTGRLLVRLKGACEGEQAVILCSGPSLREIDPDHLVHHPYVIGCNGAYWFYNNLTMWVCSAGGFWELNEPKLKQIKARYYVMNQGFPTNPFPRNRSLHLRLVENTTDEINLDLTRPLLHGPSVLLDFIMPLVVWCGFSEILLCGADYPLGQAYTHFCSGEAGAPKVQIQNNNQNDVVQALKKWPLWKPILEERGITVINTSKHSGLTLWEKRPLGDVIRTYPVKYRTKLP